ncbi:MAG: tRNA (adenosine(37)-N6)-dimethylallyltransferase MiaA [Flavobacterium sp. BFFFF2]|nr:MAG: tRNA (adenosine(37)-N6)-dimethylallyltransferase MiaA [Flavobacterium sp. BFFFF2]
MNPTLIVVVGPTAIGKTACAIALAQQFGSDIISCDSRQFFKEMRIGTAVPSPDELAAAPHHFIQHQSIHVPYSVSDFEKATLQLLPSLFQKNPIQIMVGGSGLYVNAILDGLDEFPAIDPAIRSQLQMMYKQEGLGYLQEQLTQLDSVFYQKLASENPQSLQNPQRMMRYVEVCIGSGMPYSSFLKEGTITRPFDVVCIGLEAEREVLNQRINQRVEAMMQEGLLAEVAQLYVQRSLNALQTVGYSELFDHFDGNCSLDEAVQLIQLHTRQFAKRQMTWFKKRSDIHWFAHNTECAAISSCINAHLGSS